MMNTTYRGIQFGKSTVCKSHKTYELKNMHDLCLCLERCI